MEKKNAQIVYKLCWIMYNKSRLEAIILNTMGRWDFMSFPYTQNGSKIL